METGAPWDLGHIETGVFDTENILRFVCHLVNGTKALHFLAFANIQHQGSMSSVTSPSANQQPAIHKSGTSGEVNRDWSVVFRLEFVKIWESVQAARDMQACYWQQSIEECPTFNVFILWTKHNLSMYGIISVYIQYR